MSQNAPPGQPTPEQIQAMQQQFYAEAAKRGLTPQQFGEQLKAQAMKQQQQQQQQQQQAGGQQQGQPGTTQVPIQPGPPKPEAVAVAGFLRGQPLKTRECILQQQRKELFRVKRAIRALQSPAYEKARTKNPLLPPVTDRATAENVFKLLPMSILALRISKVEPEEQHRHKKAKGKKGVWNVKVEQQQDAADDMYYVWLYEGSQWKQKLYAIGALVVVFAAVLFPLWPYTLRRGVWYLSMAALGLLGAFFGVAIVRLIVFVISIATTPPGIWIFPNLFEDVGIIDSFKPAWAWREVSLVFLTQTKESLAEKKRIKKEKKLAKRNKLEKAEEKGDKRSLKATVEEVED